MLIDLLTESRVVKHVLIKRAVADGFGIVIVEILDHRNINELLGLAEDLKVIRDIFTRLTYRESCISDQFTLIKDVAAAVDIKFKECLLGVLAGIYLYLTRKVSVLRFIKCHFLI